MRERIFVIGTNAYTAAAFIDYGLEQGLEIQGCSRSAELATPFLPYKWKKDAAPAGTFHFDQWDLNHHTDEIVRSIRDFSPEMVVNFAAQSMVAESWLHPEHWYETNVVANVRLHDELRKCTFLRNYVHVSTPEVYGTCSGLVPEETPMNPSTPYAASRAACELHLATFRKRYDFPYSLTRAANVYGPGQQLYRIIPRTIFFSKTGRKLPLHGGGHSVRSFIHGRDVARATLALARQPGVGQCYHLSTKTHISIRDLVEKICTRLGVNLRDVAEITEDRPGKDAAYLLDSAKAKKELGWEPEISLEQGIEETIGWIETCLDELKHQPADYQHKP
jgi:dTDP-glucose 4,6-dehydratase